jgi:hypothetical protein
LKEDHPETESGDHSLPITSGITTMVLTSSVEKWDMVKVLEPKLETITTEELSISKLDTEDAQEATIISCNAESTVDQTTKT